MHGLRFSYMGIFLALTSASLGGDLQYVPTDADIIMPSYPHTALRNRIQGTVIFRVIFNREKVESISVLSSTLRMGSAPLTPDPAYQEPALVRRVEERLQRTIALWTTTFLDRAEYQVKIRLRLDPGLPSGQRRFHLEYGKDSIVKLIELGGPEWENIVNPK